MLKYFCTLCYQILKTFWNGVEEILPLALCFEVEINARLCLFRLE